MPVYGLLVSAPHEKVLAFHLPFALALNHIRTVGHTYHYTFWPETEEGLEQLVEHARRSDVTVQRIDGSGRDEQYPVLHLGSDGMQWVRPPARPTKRRNIPVRRLKSVSDLPLFRGARS